MTPETAPQPPRACAEPGCDRAAIPDGAFCSDCTDRLLRQAFVADWRRLATEGGPTIV